MATDRNSAERGERDLNSNRLEGRSSRPGDLPDSSEDSRKMESEESFIDLPDVKDIPGQEFVNVPPLGALGDTTIASDDEEGVGVFDLDDSEDLTMGTDADVGRNERLTLSQTEDIPTRDEENLRTARMDDRDFQGTSLNEKSFGEERSGRDLDVPVENEVPGTAADGQGDEENKYFSMGQDENDELTEGNS